MRRCYSEKKFDEWEMSSNCKTVWVAVKSFKGGEFSYRVPTSVGFVARCEELSIVVYGTDLMELRKETQKLVEKKLKIEFVPMILITVSGHSREPEFDFNGDGEATASVEFDKFLYAFNDGKPLKKNSSSDSPKPIYFDTGWDNGSASYRVLIKDSDANREALKIIFDGFSRLNKVIKDLIATEEIEQNFIKLVQSDSGFLLTDGGS